MAKLTRYFQKIFGSNAGNNEMAEYGSFIGDPPGNLYSGSTITPDIVQNLSTFEGGQYAAMGGAYSPLIQDHNSLFWLTFRQMAYQFQAGVAEWDSQTTYYTNDISRVGNILYYSLVDNNTNKDPPTNNSDWSILSAPPLTPTIQQFLSGSGTYAIPTSPRRPVYIKVKMAGAGGGGGNVDSGSSGGNGTASTFSTLLTANGGAGAVFLAPGAGGTGTINSPANGRIYIGQYGQRGETLEFPAGSTTISPCGGNGGQNYLGGAGMGSYNTFPNPDAVQNSGGGGGGAGEVVGGPSAISLTTGGGGGAGCYIEAIIPITPSESGFSYVVGVGGTGATGVSGTVGGDGANGIIIVEEYYQ